MGKNNICVIYDSDESYAKRLMSVINDDNDIPYNAQVFTKENDLDRYLKEKKADMLMISEEAYEYDSDRVGSKTVVLCEEDEDADAIDYLLNAKYYYSANGRVENSKSNMNGTGVRCIRDAFDTQK